jgi:hypothetical protein
MAPAGGSARWILFGRWGRVRNGPPLTFQLLEALYEPHA